MKQERGAYARNIEKLKQYVVDKNQKRIADSSSSARMLREFALLLLQTTVDIMPGSRAILEQLEPLYAEIRNMYSQRMELDELKSKFKSAIGGYGPSSKCAPGVQLWTVLPQLLSFAASVACSKLAQNVVDDCRQLVSAAQHALCRIFFNCSCSKDSVSPPQLLFKDCPKGLVCATKLNNAKSEDKMHWKAVKCVNCNRPAEAHVLRFSPDDLQSPGAEQEQFLRALFRLGHIGHRQS